MNVNRSRVLQRLRRLQKLDPSVEPVRRRESPGDDNALAPRELGPGDSSQINRCALAGERCLDLPAVDFHVADAGLPAARQNLDQVVNLQPAAGKRAGHDRAEPLHGEGPVDRQSQETVRAPRPDGACPARELAPQFRQAGPGHAADRNHRRRLQKRPGQVLLDFQLDQLQDLLIDEVHLGQHDDPVADPEQATDLEVLSRLGHDGLVRRDHEQYHVDAAHARQHVLHEALVTRHIDEPKPNTRRDIEAREAQVDRDASALLLLPPVRVGSREGAYERGLAVIDVSAGADDHVVGCILHRDSYSNLQAFTCRGRQSSPRVELDPCTVHQPTLPACR